MKILILGNGFDLDMGLKTRYSDFAKSPEWDNLYRTFKRVNESNLAGFLKKKATEQNWFAIEDCLAEYAQKKIEQQDFSCVSDDKWFFELLEESLETYLDLVSQDMKDKNHLATRLLEMMNERKIFDKVYSFNYISHEALHRWCGCNYERDVCYIHQKLYCGIVLGVAEKDITDNRYSFLRKVSHSQYPFTNLGRYLMLADEVVIYGHSLNSIDFDYFRAFFQECSKYHPNVSPKKVTIITRNDESVQAIKDNLHTNGISVTELSQFCELTFIALEKYYRNDFYEQEKISSLLTRLENEKI